MRIIGFVIGCLSVLAIVGTVAAQDCRSRQVYYQPTYHAAPYVAPTYNYQNVVLVPHAVKVAVSPDYYYSVGDSYRDALLADAIAYRVLAGQQAMASPKFVPRAPAETAPEPQRQKATATKTGVPAGLNQVVETSCLKCHSGASASNGLSLDDLSTVNESDRWKSYAFANSGEMPKGGKVVSDEAVKLFYDWAKASGGVKLSRK